MSDVTMQPRLCAGVFREMRHRLTGCCALAVVAFAASTFTLLRYAARGRADASARSALALVDARGRGSTSATLDEVRLAVDDVIAAAIVRPEGTVTVAPPDLDPAEALRAAGDARGTSTLQIGEHPEAAWFVSAPSHWGRGRTIIWVRPPPTVVPALSATLLFTMIVAFWRHRSLRSLEAWLERRIATPLRLLAEGPSAPSDGSTGHGFTSGWAELTRVARRLESVAGALETSDRRVRFLERRGEDQLRASERAFERRLKHTRAQARVDPLTRLLNRRFLKEELEHIFETQQCAGADLAVAMLDLDNFKHLNDTRGHQAGDALLKFAGDLIRGTIRHDDYAVRYGGDEFVIIMPDVGRSDAEKIVRRIATLFDQFTRRQARADRVTLSAGIATRMTCHPETGNALLRLADEALYRAKRSGKNAVHA